MRKNRLSIRVVALAALVLSSSWVVAAEASENASGNDISYEQARAIAMEKVGDGKVVKADRDIKKDGRAIYKVGVIAGHRNCAVQVDAATGDVIQYHERYCDGDREYRDHRNYRGHRGGYGHDRRGGWGRGHGGGRGRGGYGCGW